MHTLHRIRTTWLFVALLLSIVAATAPSSAESGLGGAMVLTGQVDLAGDSAGALDVVLPQDVQVTDSYGPDGTFEIQAGDPTAWVGFALLRTTPDGPTGVIGGRLPASAGPGAFLLRGVGPVASAGLRLDAGVYQLFLLTQSSGTHITLRLPGLPGESSLTPAGATDYAVSSLTPQSLSTPTNQVFVAGDSHVAVNDNLVELAAMWVESATHVAGVYGTCETTTTQPSLLSYGPGCPGGSPSTYPQVQPSTSPYRSTVFTLDATNNAAGETHGLGVHYVTSTPVTTVGAVGIWLSL